MSTESEPSARPPWPPRPQRAPAASELAAADYRFVRRYIERHPAPPLSLRQLDPLIRELTHYRDVIAHKTQEEIPR